MRLTLAELRTKEVIDVCGGKRLGRVMDELKDNTFAGLSGNFESIYNELMNNNDPDLVMADFRSYVDAWEKLTGSYGDQETWNRKALLNVANSGYFSSDRSMEDYLERIWHTAPLAD